MAECTASRTVNGQTLKRLEFDKIREKLRQHTVFSLAEEKASEIVPFVSFQEVQAMLAQTDEAYRLLLRQGDLPFMGIRDVRAALKRSAAGGMLSARELVEVYLTIKGARKLKHWLKQHLKPQDVYPFFTEQGEKIGDYLSLEKEITMSIGEEAQVLDEATPALAQIRRQIRAAENSAKEVLEGMMISPHYLKMLQEPIITLREGHYVLPVKASYHSVFEGVVYGQSATGSTLFMEPAKVTVYYRRLQVLNVQEEKEVERILFRLSALVGKMAGELLCLQERLAELDLLMAKARLAKQMEGSVPVLNERGDILLKRARHPLIDREKVVPINLHLSSDIRTMVITGPNTGGKTVTLKTVGLLSCMAMSGMMVPADMGTEIPVFSNIFADIGDEQSIEQSLSTFSSHMTNIVSILKEMDGDSLLLFDELGAGTDPEEGAALAIAILDFVSQKGCRIFATTHYSELKAYAYHRQGVVNASVEFDVVTLRPTYRLLVGVPGRSNAFAIAQHLGLPQEIIQRARGLLDEESREFEQMVASLEQARQEAEQEFRQARAMQRALEEKQRELEKQLQELAGQRQRLRGEMEKQIQIEAERSHQEAEKILQELKEMVQEHHTIKEHRLIEAQKKVTGLRKWSEREGNPLPAERRVQSTSPCDLPLRVGTEVYVEKFGRNGTVVEALGKNQFQVQLGALKVNLPADELAPVTQEEKPAGTDLSVREAVGFHLADGALKPELDLRGMKLEEALQKVDRYLGEALLAGFSEVTLIHGKGTGVLRKGVQDYLRGHKHVQSYRDGRYGEGDTGVTVVTLK